jgi:hypothetical protein
LFLNLLLLRRQLPQQHNERLLYVYMQQPMNRWVFLMR